MTVCRLDGLMRGGIPRGNLVEVVGDNFSKLSLVRRVALDPLTCPGSDRSLSCCLFCSFGTICPSLQLWSRHTGEPVLISLFTDLSLADREIYLQCPQVGRPQTVIFTDRSICCSSMTGPLTQRIDDAQQQLTPVSFSSRRSSLPSPEPSLGFRFVEFIRLGTFSISSRVSPRLYGPRLLPTP
jgi:hypothetical protein